MKSIKFFKEIGKEDTKIAGGKGASLGEISRVKIPVPPGFVVTASAFERFLEETDLGVDVAAILKKINYKDINSVDRASNEIRSLIKLAKMPKDIAAEITLSFKRLRSKYVAVRSSATAEDSKTASWAGELETYLNSTSANLLANVKNCWGSLYTPRAIFYRHEKKLLKTRISVAVIVQRMIQSEISGITFTAHPVTEDRNQLLIEAGWGLGEAIVSGSITPDAYVIDKKNSQILDINVAEQLKMIAKSGKLTKEIRVSKSRQNKQKLTGRQILELAKICISVEKHYGFPCDIEWAYARRVFYITQSRPITTLK